MTIEISSDPEDFAAITTGMERYRPPDGSYRVPMPALIGYAMK